MGRRGYPPDFHRKVLDLVEAGRPIAEVAKVLGISAQSIDTWRRQGRIDRGLEPGLSSHEHDELVAARRRIAQLETELAVTRRAAELLKEHAPLSTVRGRPGDGRPRPARAGLLPGAGGLPVRLFRLAQPAALAAGDPPVPCRLPPDLRQPAGACRAHPGPRDHGWLPRRGAADAPRWPAGVTGRPKFRRGLRPEATAADWSSGSSPAPAQISCG